VDLLSEDYGNGKDEEKTLMKVLASIHKKFQFIEKKRSCCAIVNVFETRRKLQNMISKYSESINAYLKAILIALQRIEGHVQVNK
jgi:hypothetical protein